MIKFKAISWTLLLILAIIGQVYLFKDNTNKSIEFLVIFLAYLPLGGWGIWTYTLLSGLKEKNVRGTADGDPESDESGSRGDQSPA